MGADTLLGEDVVNAQQDSLGDINTFYGAGHAGSMDDTESTLDKAALGEAATGPK